MKRFIQLGPTLAQNLGKVDDKLIFKVGEHASLGAANTRLRVVLPFRLLVMNWQR